MDKLDRVRQEARRLRDLRRSQANAEDTLRELRREINRLAHETLPDLFNEAGVDHLGLPAEGNEPAYDLFKGPFYKANIAADWPEERRAAAFQWLQDNGHGDLVKHSITVEFGLREAEEVERLKDLLRAGNFQFSDTLGVPWNTLTAFCREQVEAGSPPPSDVLGLVVGEVVTLKPRKDR